MAGKGWRRGGEKVRFVGGQVREAEGDLKGGRRGEKRHREEGEGIRKRGRKREISVG